MISSDPDFEALKFITRMQWMLNFEAVATVGNDEDAIRLALQRKDFAQ
jgi:hypothetical protein